MRHTVYLDVPTQIGFNTVKLPTALAKYYGNNATVFVDGVEVESEVINNGTIRYIRFDCLVQINEFDVGFGNLRLNLKRVEANVRGLFGGGTTGSDLNVIDYVTIASTGDATDFGDLITARYFLAACSSSTRGIFGGGSPTINVIDYVTIASTGNATNFGDLITARYSLAACSNGHGGL